MKNNTSPLIVVMLVVVIIIGVLYKISFILGAIASVALLAFFIYLVAIYIRNNFRGNAPREAIYNRGSPEGYIIDHSYYTKVVGVTYSGRQRI